MNVITVQEMYLTNFDYNIVRNARVSVFWGKT